MALQASTLEVGDRREQLLTDNLTRTQIVMYAGASGDYNPLHSDEVYATQVAGYPSVFAHGMLTMGMTGRALTDWVGDGRLISYGVRFSKQVWPGDALTAIVTVEALRQDGDVLIADFSVVTRNQNGEDVVIGSASARLESVTTKAISDPSFNGRVAIVTGGTRGIGAAITTRLVAEGAHVAAVYAGNHDAAHALARSLADSSGSLSLHCADIGDAAACQAVVADVLDAGGRIDHLVNNAGLLVENSPRNMTLDEWDRAISVNLSASFYFAQAVLAPMIAQGFGRIVNVSSVTASMGSAVEAGYGAAKAGLLGLSRSLARSVARRGITVNVVVPGIFETDMTRSMSEDAQESIRAMIPAGRRGDPSELAHAVLFLLDERASYVTGSVVTVDGGISMGA